MKIAYRNFVTTLHRYRASSLMNIIGLTLAFTAFYIILVQVRWELGYNRAIPDVERVCMLGTHNMADLDYELSYYCNRPLPERLMPALAAVESGGCYNAWGSHEIYLANHEGTGLNRHKAQIVRISRSIVDMLGLEAVAGDLHAMEARTRKVIISESLSRRLGIGLGDPIRLDSSEGESNEVAGVYKDLPNNTILSQAELFADLGDQSLTDDSEWSYTYMVKLHPGTTPEDFEAAAREELGRWIQHDRQTDIEEVRSGDDSGDGEREERIARLEQYYAQWLDRNSFGAVPLRDLYFSKRISAPLCCERGSWPTTLSLLAIAVLVVVLAFINFVNFFLALVPVRIRVVNTYKVFGAPTRSLRWNFVFEALGLVVLSLLCSWYLSFVLMETPFASYINTSIALTRNLPVVGLQIGVGLVMAVAASLWPAYYITSLPPAMVVKGAFGSSKSGRRLRLLLLGVQFVVSTALIIGTGFILLQHRYMMTYDMGFDKHNLLTVSHDKLGTKYPALRERLLADPRIGEVTAASGSLVSVSRMGWGRNYKGEAFNCQTFVVAWNFPEVMRIPIVEGRGFLQSDEQKEEGTLLFNHTALKRYDMELGPFYGFSEEDRIVGFFRDFNYRPLQYGIEAFAFYIMPRKNREGGWWMLNQLYLRMAEGADAGAVTEYVRQCVAELCPDVKPGEIMICDYDAELSANYVKERKLSVIMGSFTMLSVMIALMGVFGIVLFETQHRRREIAIRKVMGATTTEILELLNRRYLAVAVVCFAVAVPLAVWSVSRWLEGFAYRTPLVWWIFAAALAIVAGITVLTVTFRSWHTACENPANTVKGE